VLCFSITFAYLKRGEENLRKQFSLLIHIEATIIIFCPYSAAVIVYSVVLAHCLALTLVRHFRRFLRTKSSKINYLLIFRLFNSYYITSSLVIV
jgi:hypothetical protein